MEREFERVLFALRWLLAPLYFGLGLALLLLAVKFFAELAHLFPLLLELEEKSLVLSVLSLIDMALVGGLVVMVMFSGYENFVSRLDTADATEKLSWLGKLDTGTIKVKLAAAIVAISAIHLLRAFMNAEQIGNDKLMWYTLIHLTLVFSALMLAVVDRIAFAAHRDH
ncbi:MAG: TIGR00645 family protein [Gammaproteobacteria bacterium]|nr:MAG: TIGR00645 family protein [Gammaproteobacteria bacterium]